MGKPFKGFHGGAFFLKHNNCRVTSTRNLSTQYSYSPCKCTKSFRSGLLAHVPSKSIKDGSPIQNFYATHTIVRIVQMLLLNLFVEEFTLQTLTIIVADQNYCGAHKKHKQPLFYFKINTYKNRLKPDRY